MIDKAILKINPNANFTINADDINQITWLNGTTPIPVADIEAKMTELQAEYDAKQYQRDNEPEQPDYIKQRRNSYPEIGDQLDMLWHSIDQDEELKTKYFNFYQAIKSVKIKHPKNG
jgi:hypothetical protein